MTNKIIQGDCLEVLKTIPDNSIDCCVTSPPYWGLRDYGTAEWEGGNPDCDHASAKEKSRYDYDLSKATTGTHSSAAQGTDQAKWKKICPDCGAIKKDSQLGLEDSPEKYVENMVKVFQEVKRVLKKEGTCWLNLGDSYMSSGGASRHHGYTDPKYTDGRKVEHFEPQAYPHDTIKPKDLVGIPWRVAFALQADGWYLRQDIIWAKPNPMPESVTDRCTKSHEYIFLLTKSPRYFFDNEAIKEDSVDPESYSGRKKRSAGTMYFTDCKNYKMAGSVNEDGSLGMTGKKYEKRNKRSVWTVNTKPYKEAHFATFPPTLITPCVLSGCPEGGVVLDPFMGSGTVALVALENNRKYIGTELNPEYIVLAEKRLASVQPKMF